MTDENGAEDLRTVQVLRMPLDVSARSTQHFDEVMREFALISLDHDRDPESTDSARPVPARLLDVVHELSQTYASFTAAVATERQEAAARGDKEIDLTYRLPPGAADASRHLEALLEEVDEFCKSGEHLITLATPPESLAFRQWYLSEFIAQIEGGRAPVSWPDYVAQHHPDADWAQR